MRIQSTTLATLLLASNFQAPVEAFTLTSPSTRSILFNDRNTLLKKKYEYQVNAAVETETEIKTDIKADIKTETKPITKTDAVTDTASETEATIEEKAWKIVDEKTKDIDGKEEDEKKEAAVDVVIESKDDNDDEAVIVAATNATDVMEETKTEATNIAEVKEEPKAEAASITDVKEETKTEVAAKEENPTILDENDLVLAIEEESSKLVEEMVEDLEEECEITETGEPADELCVDESKLSKMKSSLKKIVTRTLGSVRTGGGSDTAEGDDDGIDFDGTVPEGELLEQGWEQRGNSSALRRNTEVWKFALKCVFKSLKPRKMKKKGASEEEIKEAQIEAATFIRNGLLKLGPSFVKLVSQSRILHSSVSMSLLCVKAHSPKLQCHIVTKRVKL